MQQSPICEGQGIELIYNDRPVLDKHWDDGDVPDGKNWGQGMVNMIAILRDIEAAPGLVDGAELVDGVGIQAHLNYFPAETSPDDPVAVMRRILETFRALQLSVRITELDVLLIKSWPEPNPRIPFSQQEVEQYFANDYFYQQAEVYRNVVHHCLYRTDGTYDPICSGITTWGLMDYDNPWQKCFYPRMFNQGKVLLYDECRGIRPVERVVRFPLHEKGTDPPKAIVPKPGFLEFYDEFRTAAEASANQSLEGGYLPPTQPEAPKGYPAPPPAYPGPETKR